MRQGLCIFRLIEREAGGMMEKRTGNGGTALSQTRDQQIIHAVVEEFLALCHYPHPSWGETPLCDYMEARLKSRGWTVLRDEWGNLCAHVPAAPGRESAPVTAIQGHLDMVCAVVEGSGWDPMRDTVNAFVEDGVLRTDGVSSLGADNNLGNAAVLYLLDGDAPHGPIRLLFTVAEEIGLEGVQKMDPRWLDGVKYLINTDGFKLGRAVISSASGVRETYRSVLAYSPCRHECACALTLGGSLGGHSGYDINKGRANCIKELAAFLTRLGERVDFDLADFTGGHALNAIPMEARAVITVPAGGEDAVNRAVEEAQCALRQAFGKADPGVRLTAERVSAPDTVWEKADRDRLLGLVEKLFNGVFAMHETLPDQVAASANVGRVWKNGAGEMEINCFVRSSDEEKERIICGKNRAAAKEAGFGAAISGYPGWPGDSENPLARRMAAIYRELTGEEMEITAVHVGLEPSVLGKMNPDMDMVVTGPDIIDPHSTGERAPVAGLGVYVRLLEKTLDELSLVGDESR